MLSRREYILQWYKGQKREIVRRGAEMPNKTYF